MKIYWKDIYGFGEWRDESNNAVKLKQQNFRCVADGVELICVTVSRHFGASHGEPAFSADVPMFLYADTLQKVKSYVTFIEVDDALCHS